MENIEYILIAGSIISLASISGVALVKSHKKIALFIEKNLEQLGALSAGIFLVTSYSLGRESIETLGLQKGIVAFVIGIILYIFLQKITTNHRHIGDCDEHIHTHDRRSAVKILVGDAIHNIADGLLLVASFGASVVAGISTALSIAIHEIPQEISEFIVLRKSGYSNLEAAYKNLATALSIFIGIAIGFVFLKTLALQGYLLGVSASFFVGIIFNDLFPIQQIIKKKSLSIIAVFVLGALIMAGFSMFFSH